MANEITYSAGMRVTKGLVNVEMGLGSQLQEDMDGDKFAAGILDLTTTLELIPLGDVTGPHMACFENIGADDIVIREDLTGLGRILIKPGKRAIFGLGPGMQAPAAAALTTTSQLRYLIVQD